MAAGYGWSIMLMMGAPFVVIAIIATVIVRGMRRGS
jgi:hypothetical protein